MVRRCFPVAKIVGSRYPNQSINQLTHQIADKFVKSHPHRSTRFNVLVKVGFPGIWCLLFGVMLNTECTFNSALGVGLTGMLNGQIIILWNKQGATTSPHPASLPNRSILYHLYTLRLSRAVHLSVLPADDT